MSKYNQELHSNYQKAIQAFLRVYPRKSDNLSMLIDSYCRTCALYLWNTLGVDLSVCTEGINELYAENTHQRTYSTEQVEKVLNKFTQNSYSLSVPTFFEDIVEQDHIDGTNYSRKLASCLSLVFVSFVLIHGTVTADEAKMITELQCGLVHSCDKQNIQPYSDTIEISALIDNDTEKSVPVTYAQNQGGKIELCLGYDPNGNAFTQDISSISHFLICGFSGSGKTSFAQSMVTQICTTYSPDDVRFIIYDSKAIDYSVFNTVPHMLLPVITDTKKISGTVQWLNFEIQRRIEVLSAAGERDILGFNRKATEKLPHIIAIFDDFSSAFLDIQVLNNVLKNGRIVGAHCIIITSTPSAQVLQKDIISNLPCRISFCVSSRADSRVAIEQNGAENLQIPGEMIFKYQNILVKCQALYIPFPNIRTTMQQLRKQQKKDINQLGDMAVQLFANEKIIKNIVPDKQSDDELLPAAIDVILETGQASVSILQRRLKLEYARAAQIIDEMEEKGIVSPLQGSTPRTILITKEQWNVKNGFAPKQETKQQNSITAKENPSKEKPIALRDFPKFSVVNGTIGITNNQVNVDKKVMTRFGSVTTTACFTGDSLSSLICRKPRLFSSGYVEFKIKEKTDIINNNPDLIDIDRNKAVEFLKLEFNNAQARIVHLFLLQLAEDTHIPISGI